MEIEMYADPLDHAHAYLDEQERGENTRIAAEEAMAAEYMKAVNRGDVSALATFAAMVTDWARCAREPRPAGMPAPQRYEALWEVMDDSFAPETPSALQSPRDSTDPVKAELMQLLINVAAGAPMQAEAQDLLRRMAACYAYNNVGAV